LRYANAHWDLKNVPDHSLDPALAVEFQADTGELSAVAKSLNCEAFESPKIS